MLTSRHLDPKTTSPLFLRAVLALLAAMLLSLPAPAQQNIKVTNLTSDIPLAAAFQDSNLANPWGIASSPAGPWWVSDNGTGVTTLYDGTGNPQGLVVTIPPGSGSGLGTPTGQTFNSTSDFKINGGPTYFIFATQDGTISGWGSGTSATIAVNNTGSAVYKGIALGSANSNNYLYVANFHNGSVDVFDKNFAPFSFGGGSFTDNTIPSGFAPFNVVNIGNGQLAVTYAKQDANKQNDVPGLGNGYVTIYNTSGNLLFRLAHGPYDNSPWGVAVAPQGFGRVSGDFLVGMFRSGVIAAYTPAGTFATLFYSVASVQLSIDGIWGLGFGNGSGSGPKTTLFFTAGSFNQAHGIFGSMVPGGGPGPANDVQVQVLKQW